MLEGWRRINIAEDSSLRIVRHYAHASYPAFMFQNTTDAPCLQTLTVHDSRLADVMSSLGKSSLQAASVVKSSDADRRPLKLRYADVARYELVWERGCVIVIIWLTNQHGCLYLLYIEVEIIGGCKHMLLGSAYGLDLTGIYAGMTKPASCHASSTTARNRLKPSSTSSSGMRL